MKVAYEREVDALYICFKETTVTTKHLDDRIALDYDEANRLAGIEMLDAMKRLDDPETLKQGCLRRQRTMKRSGNTSSLRLGI